MSSIIELVCASYGYAVLTASAVAASGHADQLVARPLAEPRLTSVLCLAVSSSKRPTALAKQAMQLLPKLAREANPPAG